MQVTSSDQRHRRERLILMRPQETVHLALDELLPEREGTAVIEVRTTHPALTGNRHPRWRVWADLFWKDSFTSLHGAHNYGPEHVCKVTHPLERVPLGAHRPHRSQLRPPHGERRCRRALGAGE